ncbi:hypothetical protein [Lachnobacterium bovis]|uniref:Uncharacterized protein n=1 Tax=Lachnobacterium bovis DSM 14045 TaxID=1122142 RepID=A0A1H3HVF5_9FIRM|nr:hypothetical protein [Lachnobacterium bovis]SDY19501.1 hypothetical protein SAMN02910414_00970 [Lachnobacterium bovis DSM 14045]
MINRTFKKKVFGVVMAMSLVVPVVAPSVAVKADDTSISTAVVKHQTVYAGVDYSPVYDYSYYTKNNVDVAMAFPGDEEKVLKHFVEFGMSEGRQANTDFVVTGYKNRYGDLRAAFGNDLEKYYRHYLDYGVDEKRDGSACDTVQNPITKYKGIDYKLVYNYATYKGNYEDLAKAFKDDDVAYLKHFVEFGMNEGRDAIATATFSIKSYKNANDDLRKAFGNNLKQYYMHYIYYGNKENRIVTGKDNEIVNPVTEYNGVDYADVFDANYYRNKYLDLELAFNFDDQALLEHFVNMGMAEGRQGSEYFNVKDYRNNYEDLRKAFGSDLKKYYLHYINYGKDEERTAVGSISATPPAGNEGE